MLRFTNIFIILLLASGLVNAQQERGPDHDRMIEKMEATRMAYLSSHLDLTTEEATKFWPLYNEYSKKRLDLRKDQLEERREKRRKDLSEEESKELLDNQFETQEKELQLKKHYYEKFEAILPAQKLARLEPAEMEFNREVIRKLKERRERRFGNRPRR